MPQKQYKNGIFPSNVWGAVLSRPGPAALLTPLWKPPKKFSAYAPVTVIGLMWPMKLCLYVFFGRANRKLNCYLHHQLCFVCLCVCNAHVCAHACVCVCVRTCRMHIVCVCVFVCMPAHIVCMFCVFALCALVIPSTVSVHESEKLHGFPGCCPTICFFLRKSNLIFALLMLNHFAKQIVAHSANQEHQQYCKALCSEI